MPLITDADLILDAFQGDIVAEFKIPNFEQVAARSQPADFLEVDAFKFQGFEFALRFFPKGHDRQTQATTYNAHASLIRMDDKPENFSGWFGVDVPFDGKEEPMEPDYEDDATISVWKPHVGDFIWIDLGVLDTLNRECIDAAGCLKLRFRFVPDLAVAKATSHKEKNQTGQYIEDVGNLLTTGAFSDVVLVAGERVFQVHRNILSARSPAFERMLANDMSEASSGRIDVSDFDAPTVAALLQFLYTGSVADSFTSTLGHSDDASDTLVGKWEIDEDRESFSVTLSNSRLWSKGDIADYFNEGCVKAFEGEMQVRVPGTWRVDLPENSWLDVKLGDHMLHINHFADGEFYRSNSAYSRAHHMQQVNAWGQLMQAGDKYCVRDLVDLCRDRIVQFTTVATAATTLNFASKAGHKELKRDTLAFIVRDPHVIFPRVKDTREFDLLDPELVHEVLEAFLHRMRPPNSRKRPREGDKEFPEGQDWTKLSNAQLRRACTERDLSTDGSRDTLICLLMAQTAA